MFKRQVHYLCNIVTQYFLTSSASLKNYTKKAPYRQQFPLSDSLDPAPTKQYRIQLTHEV